MQPSTLAKRVWLLLFLAVPFYLYGLGSLPLVGPDEPRYAQVAREMFVRRDLVSPTLGGHTWFEKPVLLYWMMMASYRLFGVSEWSARLGPALAGLLTIAALYWLGRRLEVAQAPERTGLGFCCALVLASSVGLIVLSRAASFDIVVTMTLTCALSLFIASEVSEKGRSWLLAGFYCFVGLSLLGKGLIGIVIPFGVIGGFYFLRRRLPDRTLTLSVIWGTPLALVVAASWYGPVIARHGWPFINEFFIQHHFARYFSNKYQHSQPLYYYLPVLLIITLPWTPFLFESLGQAREWQWRADEPASKARVFAFAWFLVPILFFSFSGSKLPAYILPSLPAAALLAGDRLSLFLSDQVSVGRVQRALTMRLLGVMLLLLAAAGIIYVAATNKISVPCSLLILIPLVAVGVVALAGTRKRLLTVIMIALLPLGGALVLLDCAVAGFAHRESVRDLIQLADSRGYASARVFMFSRIERTSEFYAAGRVVYGGDGEPVKFENGTEVERQAHISGTPFLLIVPLGSLTQLTGLGKARTTVLGENGRIAIVAVSAGG